MSINTQIVIKFWTNTISVLFVGKSRCMCGAWTRNTFGCITAQVKQSFFWPFKRRNKGKRLSCFMATKKENLPKFVFYNSTLWTKIFYTVWVSLFHSCIVFWMIYLTSKNHSVEKLLKKCISDDNSLNKFFNFSFKLAVKSFE